MDKSLRYLIILSLFAAIFAWLVIGLGAYTRLTDAGLGCPDWPGCYGHIGVPSTSESIQKAQALYPETPVVAAKAWAEMVHRYFAGTLGLLILGIFFLAVKVSRASRQNFLFVAGVLLALLIYQAVLGMWTVTMQLLPVVVSQHLLGGMLLISLLSYIHLRAKHHDMSKAQSAALVKFKPWVLLGLSLVFLQIALGAWTSTNYASLVCSDFPSCNGMLLPHFNFTEAFNLLSPLGVNYEGGVLTGTARITIQMVHRYGAFIVSAYTIGLVAAMLRKSDIKPALKRVAWIVLAVLALQFTLGVLNIYLLLPLPIAVAHNMVAALLIVSMVALVFHTLYEKPSRQGARA